jgi:hypothetical protein
MVESRLCRNDFSLAISLDVDVDLLAACSCTPKADEEYSKYEVKSIGSRY